MDRFALAPSALFDGERLRQAHAVVVDGGRIAGIAPVGALPEEMEVRWLPGCTLLPGLIDCHTHISDWMLPGFLAAGVTTVRDTGNDLATAVAAGVREVQHLTGCVHHVEGWRTDTDAVTASAASLAAAGVVQCPTLVVWDRLCRLNDTAFRHDRRDRWVHPEIASVWQRFPHRTGEVTDRLDRQRSVNTMKRVVGALAGAGSRIVAGSDAPFPHLVPGFSLHDELSLLVDAGLAPAAALATATSVAADVLSLGDAGRIRPGAVADMVAVGGNPLDDICVLSDVRLVLRRGRVVDLEALAATAAEAFSRSPEDPFSRLMIDFAKPAGGGSRPQG